MWVTNPCISKNTFRGAEGKVPDQVLVSLVEAFTIQEMLCNGLSTTTNGQLLETDGMLFLDATSSAEEKLIIAEGKEIFIQMPSQNPLRDPQIFSGEFTNQDLMNWKEPYATEKFLTNLPLLQLDFYPENYSGAKVNNLTAGKVNTKAGTKTKPEDFSQDSANGDIAEVGYCGITKELIESLYSQTFDNTLISTREFESRMPFIHRSCNENVFKAYLENIDKDLWEIDSIAYEILLKEKNEQAAVFKLFKAQGKTRLKGANLKDQIYSDNITNSFREIEQVKARKKLSSITFNAFYTTSLGWINVDKLLDLPAAISVRFEVLAANIDKSQECKMYIVFTSFNSILELNRKDDGVFTASDDRNEAVLPKGEKVHLIAISNNGKTPMLAMKDFVIGNQEKIEIELLPVTPDELKLRLKQYNKPTAVEAYEKIKAKNCCQEYLESSDILL